MSLRNNRLKKQHKDKSRDIASLNRDGQTERLLELMNLGRQMDAPHRDVTQ
jgi:hypothetical protein